MAMERVMNNRFMTIPLELIEEILMKLPARSIPRLCLVSKHLSSIITGKEFTDMYMARSSTRPHYLISVYQSSNEEMLFYSFSQEDPWGSDHMVSSTLAPGHWYIFSPPIRGLICGRKGDEIMIGNPSTSQFVLLPRVETKKSMYFSVLGYDPVNDSYKVLCLAMMLTSDGLRWEANESAEHHVITVGAKQQWKMVECKYPHRHCSDHGTQGICRDGVVYYLASYKRQRTLLSFHLSSEEFSVTKLPRDSKLLLSGTLVNHSGKITIASQFFNGPIDLWVLEDSNKGVWSKVAAVVPSKADICGRDQGFVLRGILSTGEIIFISHPHPAPKPFFLIFYDPNKKSVKKVVLKGFGDGSNYIDVFCDHVESFMFM